ncbi:YheC/YheD family protein [Paenibacillus glycinis]|uniref:YheC/YheD family protein n=1 Tax=Paenibacillus glycinis TaxID=2697035 RepID=A0ABW9XXH4_9BACL|nr:YheC/YheD family protein [Paenibacillus glycinis]NBD27334.1 YheC/YheD family protein [Paenibacillus glycinis]
MSRYVGSKWRKTAAIRKSAPLAQYVPDTLKMTGASLLDRLNQYGMVYIKPDLGMYGNGVMRVERRGDVYSYQVGNKRRDFARYSDLYRSIKRRTGSRRYLVQKGIHLLKYGGRRFDLRVMVQWSPSRTWETTGIIGRVAAKNKIVTNYHSGGKIVAADALLRAHTDQPASKLQALSRLGAQAGAAMQQAFPGVYVIGLDVAMDKSMHPWILEVNTRPDPYIFKKHPDRKVFRKIMRYAKAYAKK